MYEKKRKNKSLHELYSTLFFFTIHSFFLFIRSMTMTFGVKQCVDYPTRFDKGYESSLPGNQKFNARARNNSRNRNWPRMQKIIDMYYCFCFFTFIAILQEILIDYEIILLSFHKEALVNSWLFGHNSNRRFRDDLRDQRCAILSVQSWPP